MKKIFIAALFLFSFSIIKSQNLSPANNIKLTDKELGLKYLKNSRGLKIAGWSLLAGGIILSAVGVNESSQDIFSPNTGGETIALVGTILALSSIPCFIVGAKNKGRAEILLRNENIMLSYKHARYTNFPSVAIAFKL